MGNVYWPLFFIIYTLRLLRIWVMMVSKCIVGLFRGTHFQHGGKCVTQNSPTMHFDNHLDPASAQPQRG